MPPFGLAALTGGGQQDSVTRLTLRQGDRLLLYTDGLSEARDREGRFYPVRERGRGRCCAAAPRGGRCGDCGRTWPPSRARPPDDDSALLLLEFVPPS
ncbi:hypothetical protein GCM10020229_28170 [Kitasatospora albolonga]